MRVDGMPSFTLGEIAERLGGTLVGDGAIRIDRVRALQHARTNEIAVLTESKYFSRVDTLAAEAVVVPAGVSYARDRVIVVPDAKRAFVTLLGMFDRPPARTVGIHPRAVIAEGVRLGQDIAVGPGAVIESGASIGDRATIGANCYVGANVVLGDDTTLHPNVTLYERTVIGQRVTIHSGTVIGSDGFGYVEVGAGEREKIPQLGYVEIGDDVEIGANCGIDRATLEKTSIGRGTKIDNLVQIGHNTQIGEHCCIVGQAGIAGSATIGNYVVLSGQVGISDHVTVGDRVVLAAQTGVHSDLHSGIWIGTPAMPFEKGLRALAALQNLPDYRERLRTLEDLLAAMEKRLKRIEAFDDAEPVSAGNGNGRGNGSGYLTEPADET